MIINKGLQGECILKGRRRGRWQRWRSPTVLLGNFDGDASGVVGGFYRAVATAFESLEADGVLEYLFWKEKAMVVRNQMNQIRSLSLWSWILLLPLLFLLHSCIFHFPSKFLTWVPVRIDETLLRWVVLGFIQFNLSIMCVDYMFFWSESWGYCILDEQLRKKWFFLGNFGTKFCVIEVCGFVVRGEIHEGSLRQAGLCFRVAKVQSLPFCRSLVTSVILYTIDGVSVSWKILNCPVNFYSNIWKRMIWCIYWKRKALLKKQQLLILSNLCQKTVNDSYVFVQ